jgi:hypothetical protein
MSLDFRLIALHGGALATLGSFVIMGALRYNPRLFLRHFPEAVRIAQPAHTPGEKLVGRAVGLLLIGLFVGIPVWSAHVAAAAGRAGFLPLLVHAFLVGMIFNAVDWLVLDELWLRLGRPRWALPPGVGPEDVPWSHTKHFRDFLRGSLLFLAIAAAAALVASR